MANAPVPGAARRDEERRSAIKISTADGRDWTLHMSDLGPNDDIMARKATGLPVTPYFMDDRFGMDSLLVIMWIARRKSGEPNLRWDDVVNEFPTYESIGTAGISIEAVEDGPQDAVQDEEVGVHPLP